MIIRHATSINREGARSAHPNVIGPAALHGRKGIRRDRFLPSPDGALAQFPWTALLDAAEEAQSRYGNINAPSYEGLDGEAFGQEAIVRDFGLLPLGEEAVREVHEKGAVLLAPPSAEIRARLLQGLRGKPAPRFPWDSAATANTVADFFFTLLPTAFGRRLYMSHAGDYQNNLMNLMPAPALNPLVKAIPPEVFRVLLSVVPAPVLRLLGLPPRIQALLADARQRRMAEGLIASSQSLIHRWHVDVGHAQRLPELTALLNVRNPTRVPTYVAHLSEILGCRDILSEDDIRCLEAEPLLNRCLCANSNVVSMAVLSHERRRTRFAAGKQYRLGRDGGSAPESPAMLRALERFERACDQVGYGVELEPGEVLVLTNDAAVHGRYPLEPQPVPPPTDRTQIRWNKLLYMARPEDLPAFEAPAARWRGRRWIVDKRAFFDWDAVVATAERVATRGSELGAPSSLGASADVEKARRDRERFAQLYAGR